MLKKFFALILALGLVASVNAAAPTYAAEDGVYEWFLDTTLTVTDTLTAAADTSTIISNYDIEQGWQYILYRTAWTGDGSDSVACQLVVENEDDTGGTLYSVVVDSFTTSAGEAVDLAVGGTSFGSQVDIHVIGIADIGGEVISPTYYLVKRRPYVWERRK